MRQVPQQQEGYATMAVLYFMVVAFCAFMAINNFRKEKPFMALIWMLACSPWVYLGLTNV